MLNAFLLNLEKKSTVKTKLLAGFGVVLLFNVVVGCVSIFGYYLLNQNTEFLFKSSTVGISESRQLQAETFALDSQLNRLLLVSKIVNSKTDPQGVRDDASLQRDDANTKIGELRGKIEATLKRIEATIVRDQVRLKFNEMVENFNTYFTAIEQLQILEKSSTEAATKMYLGPIFQAFEPTIFKTIQTFIDLRFEGAQMRYDDSKTVAMRTTILTVIALLVGFGISIFVALFVRHSITSPLNKTKIVINDLAESRLNSEVECMDYVGVTGQIANSVSILQSNLRHSLKEISDNAAIISSSSEELAAVSAQLNSNAEETAMQANEVAKSSDTVSQNTQIVAASAEEFGASIREISVNAVEVANQAVQIANSTNQQMANLRNSSVEIGQVLKVISGIAEQTNLLALNATIEAARAGELGKGFAVVANEVKDLARSTANATDEIGQSINAIQSDAMTAIQSIEEITQIINKISDISNVIATAVEEQAVTVGEISRNISGSASSSAAIAETIQSVAGASKNITQGSAEIQKSSGELAKVSTQLKDLVARFQM